MSEILSCLLVGLWIIIILVFAILSKKRFPYEKELSRKIVHIGIGPIAPIAWLLEIPKEIAVSAAAFVTFILILNKKVKLIGTIEDINRKSYGTIAYGISITIMLHLFWSNNADAVCAGLLVMAFGDGLAGIIGAKFNSYTWKILGQSKSVLGTFTMLLVTFITLISIAYISKTELNILIIFYIALIATILEQFGPWGLDNLSVPISVSYIWKLFSPNIL